MTPEEMARRARAVGLDGVVITEHNAMWSDEEIAHLREQFPDLLFFRGMEVSAKGHHVLVYGFTDATGFEAGMPVSDVVAQARDRGGVAVWAHPLQKSLVPDPDVMQVGFDACETRSMNIDRWEQSEYSKLAMRLGVSEMWNSDAHHVEMLGPFATRFDYALRDEKDLAEAIRKGAFTPEERKEWSDAAYSLREEYWHHRIRRLIAEGMSDPVQIKRKAKASLPRIQEILTREGVQT